MKFKTPALFDWYGFEKLDLLNDWQKFKETRYEPILFDEEEYGLNSFENRISDLYSEIYSELDIVEVDNIAYRAKEIHSFLIQAKDFLVEECKEDIESSQKYEDEYYLSWAPSLLLSIAHSDVLRDTEMERSDSEESKDFLILALMLIEKFMELEGKDKFLSALDAHDCSSHGLEMIHHKTRRSYEASKRARKRHKIRDSLYQYAIMMACDVRKTKTHLSIRQLAKIISDDVKSEAKKLNFYYTDRFDQTIYEWLLKANKEGELK